MVFLFFKGEMKLNTRLHTVLLPDSHDFALWGGLSSSFHQRKNVLSSAHVRRVVYRVLSPVRVVLFEALPKLNKSVVPLCWAGGAPCHKPPLTESLSH